MPMWSPDVTRATPPLYRAIADQIGADLASGKLSVGDRLPTHRELATRLGIARGTITRAYADAERRGLIHSVVGRGTFVGAMSDGEAFKSGHQLQPGVIDLSLNLPLYDQDPDLAIALAGLAKERGLQELLCYYPPAGRREHREAGTQWLARCGLDASTEQVVVCSGAQHAQTVALSAVAEPGDVVLTDEVTYPGLVATARLLHLEVQGLTMDAEGMTPAAFAAACRKPRTRAVYLMPTIQNPTAAVMSFERRREIAKIAEAHGIAIIEDDIHRLLLEDAPPPLASLAPATSYYIGSVSKALAGGLRIAWLAGPPHMTDRLIRGIHASVWMTSPITVELAARWIRDGTADTVIARKRQEAAARQDMARELLGARHCDPHRRALHVWLELPPGRTAASFTQEARMQGVAVTPAEAFYVGSERPPRAVRVCLGAAPSRARLRQGLERVHGALQGTDCLGAAIV